MITLVHVKIVEAAHRVRKHSDAEKLRTLIAMDIIRRNKFGYP